MENTQSTFLKNILNKAIKPGEYRKPLFHYTNAEGLKGIINDGKIWGSHYKYTNDPTEFDYSYKLMAKILKQFIKKEKDSRIKHFFETFLSWMEKQIEIDKYYLNNNIYLASFSEEKDLLSQWRGYGDNASGYSIGIDLFSIDRINTDLSSFQKRIKLKKIFYKEKTQKIIINNYFNNIKNYIMKNKQLKEHSGLLYAAFIISFLLIVCLFKDPHFKEEQEWRLIYDPIAFTENDELNDNKLAIKYRTNNSVIIPYVKMNITNDNSDLISVNEIICGPKSDETKAIMGLKMLLREKGYSDDTINKIHKSAIPLT